MTTFIHEPDAEGEPCLWVAVEDGVSLRHPMGYGPVYRAALRRVDLTPDTRHHWDELVERITGEKP